MFTGIVEGFGTVKSIKRKADTAIFEIQTDFDLSDTNVGDSISVDGCCLTATSRLGNRFWADLSDETLRVTNLGKLQVDDKVNVERALKVGARFGGHIVYGHIDGVGKIKSFRDAENGKELEIHAPRKLMRYIVEKGSVAVDGVSLTVNKVMEEVLAIRIIPHTLGSTTFKYRKVGDPVNLEVDIVGKYVEKLRFHEGSDLSGKGRISEDYLRKHGF